MKVQIERVRITTERRSVGVEEFFLYRLPSYEEIEERQIVLPASSSETYEVSFAPHRVFPSEGRVAVEIEFVVDGVGQRVESPWSSTRRTPKGR